MKLSEIYTLLKAAIEEITGQTYVFDRAPAVNFSEGYSGTYRYIRPASIVKERRSQGTPETRINMQIGILAFHPTATDIDAAEDELDGLLTRLLRRAQIADNVLIYAAETNPTNNQIIAQEGLDSEVQVLGAVATIALRAYY